MQQQKPLKMFIYQPLFVEGTKAVKAVKAVAAAEGVKAVEAVEAVKATEDKHVRSVIVDNFPYFRVELGDVFTNEKRPAKYHELIAQQETKVEAVRYNLAERACIVILERKTFKSQREIDRYVSGKKSV